MMRMNLQLVLPIQRLCRVVWRGAFYFLSFQIDGNGALGPVHIIDPLRSDEHLVT